MDIHNIYMWKQRRKSALSFLFRPNASHIVFIIIFFLFFCFILFSYSYSVMRFSQPVDSFKSDENMKITDNCIKIEYFSLPYWIFCCCCFQRQTPERNVRGSDITHAYTFIDIWMNCENGWENKFQILMVIMIHQLRICNFLFEYMFIITMIPSVFTDQQWICYTWCYFSWSSFQKKKFFYLLSFCLPVTIYFSQIRFLLWLHRRVSFHENRFISIVFQFTRIFNISINSHQFTFRVSDDRM